MKTEELIIDGRRVDMSPDTRIVLNFKSNLLNDISKITASNSQTISLPKTIHNRDVFDHATAPSHNSTFYYSKHRAEYIRNGVKIISDATAVLLDSAENYEIALYWGEMTKFQSWVESDAKISDLDFSNIYQIWRNPVTLATCYNGDNENDYYFPDDNYLFYVDYDCGLGSAETMNDETKKHISLHPVMSVRQILLKIQQESGITFDFPAGFMTTKQGAHARSEVFRGLAIPMLTRKTSNPSTVVGTITGYHNETKGTFHRVRGLNISLPNSTLFTTENKSVDVLFGGSPTMTIIKFSVSGRVRIPVSVTVGTARGGYFRENVQNGLLGWTLNGVVMACPCKLTTTKYSSNNWRYLSTVLSYTIERDVEAGDEIGIYVYTATDTDFYKFSNWDNSGFGSRSISVVPPAVEVDISLGDYFRVNGNLPGIKQLEFVKAICSMYGLFVVPSGEIDKLKFITLDELLARRSDAVDWSSRLIRSNGGEPERIKFTIGDYARRNMFRYAEDETVLKSGDGEIYINNETLEPTKDIITLPFAASDETIVDPGNNIAGALIHQYSTGENGTPVLATNLKPRILQIVSNGTVSNPGDKAIGRFIPLSFDRLIARYYQTLSDVLNSAITITEKIRLTEFDILNLDFTRPVYLKQYGRYYGIVSVQTGEDDICTVELLQFPVGSTAYVDVLYSRNGGETYEATIPSAYTTLLVRPLLEHRRFTQQELANIFSLASNGEGEVDLSRTDYESSVFPVFREIKNQRISRLSLPNGIQTIDDDCFSAASLRTVILPKTIVTIGRNAFNSTYISQIDIPETCGLIYNGAFSNCLSLKTIICRAKKPPVLSGGNPFDRTGETEQHLYLVVPEPFLYNNNANWRDYLIRGRNFTVISIEDYESGNY